MTPDDAEVGCADCAAKDRRIVELEAKFKLANTALQTHGEFVSVTGDLACFDSGERLRRMAEARAKLKMMEVGSDG